MRRDRWRDREGREGGRQAGEAKCMVCAVGRVAGRRRHKARKKQNNTNNTTSMEKNIFIIDN